MIYLPGDDFTCRKVIDSWQHKGTNRSLWFVARQAREQGYLWTALAVAS